MYRINGAMEGCFISAPPYPEYFITSGSQEDQACYIQPVQPSDQIAYVTDEYGFRNFITLSQDSMQHASGSITDPIIPDATSFEVNSLGGVTLLTLTGFDRNGTVIHRNYLMASVGVDMDTAFFYIGAGGHVIQEEPGSSTFSEKVRPIIDNMIEECDLENAYISEILEFKVGTGEKVAIYVRFFDTNLMSWKNYPIILVGDGVMEQGSSNTYIFPIDTTNRIVSYRKYSVNVKSQQEEVSDIADLKGAIATVQDEVSNIGNRVDELSGKTSSIFVAR